MEWRHSRRAPRFPTQVPVAHIRRSHPAKTFDGGHRRTADPKLIKRFRMSKIFPDILKSVPQTYKKELWIIIERVRTRINNRLQQKRNKNAVDHLYVTFNLKDGTYKPYHKPDNQIAYINVQSNHPPNIIKQLPKTIEQRLSNNSSNEIIFNEAAPLYEKAFSEAGCNVTWKQNKRR